MIRQIYAIVNFLVGIASLVAMGYIVYGGVRMVTAFGDDGVLKSAKDTMTNAITGLVIVLLAYLIVTSIVSYVFNMPLEQLINFFSF